MIDFALAIIFAGLTAWWRFLDGSDHRPRHSNIYAACLCLIAVLTANGGLLPPGVASILNLKLGVHLLAAGLVFYLLIRGMPGWTHFLPNPHGKGMLLTYALPMFAVGLLHCLMFGLSYVCVVASLSGFVPCLVYVLGSRLENKRKLQGHSHGGSFLLLGRYWTAEEWGRVSMGALVFPLPLL